MTATHLFVSVAVVPATLSRGSTVNASPPALANVTETGTAEKTVGGEL